MPAILKITLKSHVYEILSLIILYNIQKRNRILEKSSEKHQVYVMKDYIEIKEVISKKDLKDYIKKMIFIPIEIKHIVILITSIMKKLKCI